MLEGAAAIGNSVSRGPPTTCHRECASGGRAIPSRAVGPGQRIGRILRETSAAQPSNIRYDETPIHVYMKRIHDRLRAHRRLPFSELLNPTMHRSTLIGLFLAVLELVRHQARGWNGCLRRNLIALAETPPRPSTFRRPMTIRTAARPAMVRSAVRNAGATLPRVAAIGLLMSNFALAQYFAHPGHLLRARFHG
jgi:hypothetical protein